MTREVGRPAPHGRGQDAPAPVAPLCWTENPFSLLWLTGNRFLLPGSGSSCTGKDSGGSRDFRIGESNGTEEVLHE